MKRSKINIISMMLPLAIIVSTILLLSIMNISASAATTSKGLSVPGGSALKSDEYISSPNGNYRAYMQTDGNFVVYFMNGSSMKSIWSSGTAKGISAYAKYEAIMQGDGNFVIYAYNSNGGRTALWSTCTSYLDNDKYSLNLSNYGELYIKRSSGKFQWSSKNSLNNSGKNFLSSGECITSLDKSHFAMMQYDGNFVIYKRSGTKDTAIWSTGTSLGTSTYSRYEAVMQYDGNFVVYGYKPDGNRTAVWHAQKGTPSNPSVFLFQLTLNNDGSLFIWQNYVNSGKPATLFNTVHGATTQPTSNVKVQLNVPYYNQSGGWGNIGNTNETISKSGCIVTSLAMLVRYETGNANITPSNVDEYLELTFDYGGGIQNWGVINSHGYYVNEEFKDDYLSSHKQQILALIYNKLKSGHPVVYGADAAGNAGMHYVIITGYKGTSTSSFNERDFVISDPGHSSNTTLAQLITNTNKPRVNRLIYKR